MILRRRSKTEKSGRHTNSGFTIDNYNQYFISHCNKNNDINNYTSCILSEKKLRTNLKKEERMSEMAKKHTWFMENFINIQIQIAEGLRHFHVRSKNYGNFNADNIRVDISGNVQIVDFGLTCLTMDDYRDIVYNPSSNNVAPEINVIAGMKEKMDIYKLEDDIFDKKMFLQTIDNIFYNYSLRDFIKSVDIQTDVDGFQVLKTYALCSDIWSMGVMLFILYMNAISDPETMDSSFYENHHLSQMKVFEGMLHVDPRKRFTIDMVLNELYSMRMSN
jgi:serine/threonine protein kinase